MRRGHFSGNAPTDWDAAPSHKPPKPHSILTVSFGPYAGDTSSLVCFCGWSCEGPTPEHIESAYIAHRHELGLVAPALSVMLPLAKRGLDNFLNTR
jgi:hypothetical protein